MAEPLPIVIGNDDRRDRLRRVAERHVAASSLIPPLTLDELRRHADLVLLEAAEASAMRDLATILVSNAVWRPVVEAIPFARRVLLLPQCLRDRATCPAVLDAVGLLCEECGGCVTGALQAAAEALGYVVLVAEGTTVVTSLLATGQVDCVVGVSCLATLERSFPHTTAAAVPALAIPLLCNGCDRTAVDADWVLEAIHTSSGAPSPQRTDLDALRSEVGSWFTPDQLQRLLNLEDSHAEAVAVSWMATGGKRWRPFLAAAVQRVLSGDEDASRIRPLAVAVECFHKASLAHDDIEDGDDDRYGLPTLHRQHGMPIALNAGDLLVGEGYRLIAGAQFTAEQRGQMLEVAAQGHRELCVGQGAELDWTRKPAALDVEQALHIFRRKTAPAFRVALTVGAIAGGGDRELCSVLAELSDALGIAYQIRDDIEDFTGADGDLAALRPSLLVALALTSLGPQPRRRLIDALTTDDWAACRDLLDRADPHGELENRAWELYSRYRDAALHALRPLRHQPLKSLMFRIVHKVLPAPSPLSKARHRRPDTLRQAPLPVRGQGASEGEATELDHVV